MIQITPMTPDVPRKDLGTFRKQLTEARGPVFDAMTGLLLFFVTGFSLGLMLGAL
ncbi:hypothetical protein EDE05_12842 [Neorhizobium sp. R1-B]|uniref:hypothetical protein n=1 Tax=Neorhizobium sp. R1-B TaxID=2485162 RepID=UPI0010E1304B|nr:hypothetical protein [Neorhizobium sp. R1-B]TDX72621.1 hypothetical protein EDE05_12842 [Neorhizobium sp. R1-B]